MSPQREDDPLWYKDAVIYELHVKSFADSNGDGIGDFRGLTQKLDYLSELGVTALWLLPFYPSPQRDDGYDIGSYTEVNPSYGTLADFREFLEEAHRRGLKVITELVINHTSDQHPWFQRARRAPRGSAERDFYVWSDDPTKYGETRIIFKDFEPSNWTWDAVADQYYWHRFFHHQPDLNFDNPQVHEHLFRILDFWLGMGVDGLRLDAIPYLYEREGTNCENLPETHVFLKKLRAHVDQHWKNRMFLAEANQWPEDAAAYFGTGDECHMNFHFPIMPRLFMALRMEDRFPITDILEQTPAIPATCQWAIFLRNHDELTLEMVTDEERDYMYRSYALEQTARINLGIRRRLAPLLQNHRRKIELMNSLLLSLPGTPVMYYGDEIGMGDNYYLGDRNGVRTPMQWSADRNAGFSRANPQQLFLPVIIDPEYSYESVNVETQHANPSSLLWWMRRLLALRGRHAAFGRGDFRWVEHANKRVLVFTRSHENETILVVANLSRFAQAIELDLKEFMGAVPVELFGHTRFPAIGELPYLLTLGPHTFYWFRLEARAVGGEVVRPQEAERVEDLALVETTAGWETLLEEGGRHGLREALVTWLPRRRWFGGKAKSIRSVRFAAHVPVPLGDGRAAHLLLLEVDYVGSEAESYLLPLMFSPAADVGGIHYHSAASIVCRVRSREGEGVLHDAAASPLFACVLYDMVAGAGGVGIEGSRLFGLRDGAQLPALNGVQPTLGTGEQSNSSIAFGDRYQLKLLRRVEEGVNLDREMGLALTRASFRHTPEVLGGLDLRWGGKSRASVGVLQRYVPNEGDAWAFTLESLGRYFERALTVDRDAQPPATPIEALLEVSARDITGDVAAAIGDGYLDAVRLLGTRTAELHLALADVDNPDFKPEPFTTLYQRSLYQAMRNLVGQTFETFGGSPLPEDVAAVVQTVVKHREQVMDRFRALRERRIEGQRIRIHGDLHLGQVLYTGKDFVFIDFEGEPSRPLSERRLVRSPMRDVASMLRSFDYAAMSGLARVRKEGRVPPEWEKTLEERAIYWREWASAAYVKGYLEGVGSARFLPRSAQDRQLLLDIFLLERCVYELGYELANRPAWAGIPARGVLRLLHLGGDG